MTGEATEARTWGRFRIGESKMFAGLQVVMYRGNGPLTARRACGQGARNEGPTRNNGDQKGPPSSSAGQRPGTAPSD